ncbi:SLBB domain-containing protein [Ancylothrix sp. C2]|nr:SLBB domain-containing protein [Ancylothrix sp. D3o]
MTGASLPTGTITLIMAGILNTTQLPTNAQTPQLLSPPPNSTPSFNPPASGTRQGGVPQTSDLFRTYRLGPGDQIFVQVFRYPDLTFNGQINPEGKIIMPLIGSLSVQGLTLEQAQELIQVRLSQFIRDPIVTLALAAQRPVNIAITGEVGQPGFYVIPTNIQPRIASAIILAGGANPTADLRFVRIRRTLNDGTVLERNFDLFTPLQSGGELPSERLEDGDVIIIPKQDITTAPSYNPQIISQSNLASNRPISVTVAGEVGRPGFYPLPPQSVRVFDALQIAGGLTAASDLSSIKIRRTLSDGSVIEQTLDFLTPLTTGTLPPAFRLSEGDVIFIPKREISSAGDEISALIGRSTLASQTGIQVTVTGEIAKPGFYPLQANASRVSDVLLLAGGITQTADLRAVRVRRSLGEGRYSEETLDLFTPLQNSQPLPDLRLANGDAVIVPRLEPGTDAAYDRRLIARSTLAKPTINVRILSYPSGAAGTVSLPNGSSFADALNNIPLDRANLRSIALIRFDPEQGKAVSQDLDGKEALLGDPTQNPMLQDNDVIVVGRNLVARISYALNTFTQPFRDILGFLLFFESLSNSATNLFAPPGTNR